jgi:acetoin utilization deacetylase AcuC-like enzyme
MKVFHTDAFTFPLPETHRFPLEKYARLRERIEALGFLRPGDLEVAPAAQEQDLLRAHSAEYISKVMTGNFTDEEIRKLGLPWSPELAVRSLRSVGATIAAARAALQDGAAAQLGGGTHHAFRDRGEGFCVFNDVVVAIRLLQAEGRIRRALILDFDVHQGNGTAAILAGDDSVFTLSVHGSHNYPLQKEQSSLDIELADRAGDESYLAAVRQGLEAALQWRSAGDPAGLAVVLAGADPYEGDRLGRLGVSREGLAERDRIVSAACRAAGLPIALTMAGGYARNIEETVEIQAETVRIFLGSA